MFALKKRKRNKKKNSLLGFIALIVAVAMVSIGVTLAVEPPSNFETNVVVIGEVKIDIIDKYYEKQPDYNPDDPEGTGKHYTKDNPPVLSPDTTVNKEISVKNIGRFPCYVRLLVKKEWTGGDPSLISLNYDQTNWYKGADVDGYECYYYKDILPVAVGNGTNAIAPPLCETFVLGHFDPDAVGGTTGDIKVFAQAVQSDYVDSVDLPDTATDETIAACEDATLIIQKGMIVKWYGLVFN